MRKWVAAIIILFFLGLCAADYLNGVSLRKARIISAKGSLEMAYKDYLEHGYVTNYGSLSYEVWLSTNVTTIEGTQYQCFVMLRDWRLQDQGILAMTTNQVFIWMDAKRAPKIVDAGYRAPLFPP